MIAVLSDIHGNLPALKAVLTDLCKYKCQKIISLGDVVGYYSQPVECIDILREVGAIHILGNHDSYMVSGNTCPRSKMVSEIIEFQRPMLKYQHVRWLSNSYNYYVLNNVYFTHGGYRDNKDQYLYKISINDFPPTSDIFFTGHTHVQVHARVLNKQYCNPGSVGQPRDGDCRAAYALLENDQIELKRVNYDIEATVYAMKKAGFSSKFSDNLFIGAQIGGRIDNIKFNK